jgi:hypothetical protein
MSGADGAQELERRTAMMSGFREAQSKRRKVNEPEAELWKG